MKKFFEDFKKFITRGNVVDMAVGVIVGGAFNTIVTTMNQKILMPIVNWALSYVSKGSELCTVLPNYTLYDPIKHAGATPVVVNGVSYYSVNFINWSALIEAIINFFFIALTLFVILRVFAYLSEKREKFQEFLKQEAEENQKPE
jgi:large conductance mechanosensitive channel